MYVCMCTYKTILISTNRAGKHFAMKIEIVDNCCYCIGYLLAAVVVITVTASLIIFGATIRTTSSCSKFFSHRTPLATSFADHISFAAAIVRRGKHNAVCTLCIHVEMYMCMCAFVIASASFCCLQFSNS